LGSIGATVGCIEVVGTAEAKSEGLGVGSRVVGEIVGEAEGESSVGFALLVGLPVGGGVDTVGYAVGEPGSTGAREGGIVVSCVGRVSKPSEGSLLAAAGDVETAKKEDFHLEEMKEQQQENEKIRRELDIDLRREKADEARLARESAKARNRGSGIF